MSVNYLLKRTSTADKRPTAAQLDIGEIALNYEGGDPGLYFEDSNGAVRKIGPVTVGGTAPNASPAGSSGNSAGELWLDNSGGDTVLKVWDGSAWQTAASNTGTAGGSDTQVQFSNSGVLSGDANFTFDSDNDILSVTTMAGDLNGAVVFTAQADQNLTKGQVVYISGISGNTPTVDLARANSSSTMPAYGLVDADITSGATGKIVTFGQATNLDTDTPNFSEGDTVYVSATSGGELVNTPPTGEGNLIQNIGRVERVSATVGRIVVGGAGRSNATPNLNEGNIFLGDSNNQATTTSLSTAISSTLGLTRTAGTGTVIQIDTAAVNLQKDLAFSQASDLAFIDNDSEALQLTDSLGNAYITFDSTDDSECIKFDKKLCLSAGTQVDMSGSTTITLLDNDFDALDIKEGNNLYMRFNTTNSGEKLQILKNIYLAAELHLADYLLMDNANQIRFRELNSQGTHYVALQGPGVLSATSTLTLPEGAGTDGQSMRTDGNGVLSWKDTPTSLFGINAHASFDASEGSSFDWSTDKVAEGNITSVTRSETGVFVINFDRDFSSANYTVTATAGEGNHTSSGRSVSIDSRAAGSVTIRVERTDTGAQIDSAYISVIVVGTLS